MGRPKPPEHDNRDDERRRRPKKLELRLVEATELSAHNLGHLVEGTEHVINRLSRIADALEGSTTPPPQGEGHTTIHVVAVELKNQEGSPMPPIDHMPPMQLPASTVRAKLSVVDARKPDGSRVASVTWSSSDETQLPLEPIADSTVKDESGADVADPADGQPLNVFSTYANTPLEQGAGTVTVKSAGMADCDIAIAYSDPPVGHFAIVGVEAAEE